MPRVIVIDQILLVSVELEAIFLDARKNLPRWILGSDVGRVNETRTAFAFVLFPGVDREVIVHLVPAAKRLAALIAIVGRWIHIEVLHFNVPLHGIAIEELFRTVFHFAGNL